jgi:hypothetical protein
MDHLTVPMANRAGKATPAEQSVLQYLLPVLAVLVWVIEYKRRAPPGSTELRKRVKKLIPEMVVLTVLAIIVAISLVCRREQDSPQDEDSWRSVKKEWQLLITADTLLGLQAMLRLVFLLSASFRRTAMQLSPFDAEPATYFMLAAVARVSILFLSPRDVYHLDGPLGGDMNVAVEITGLLLLLPLGCRILRKGLHRVGLLVVNVSVLAYLAYCHHFALADHPQVYLDVLFSLSVLLEIAAALAFLVRSFGMSSSYSWDAFTGFAHFMLPIQQTLPTYFLLVAFAPPFKVEPALVGKGHPFEVLQAGTLVAVVVYLIAAFIYSMACFDENKVSSFAAVVPLGEAPPGEECVICLGNRHACCDPNLDVDVEATKQQWRRLQCGHHFHENCIFEWMKKSAQCPMCRQSLSTDKDVAKNEESAPLLERNGDSAERSSVQSIMV